MWSNLEHFDPLKIRIRICLNTAKTHYPVTQNHIPEDWGPQIKLTTPGVQRFRAPIRHGN
jgi:hypothetical protein